MSVPTPAQEDELYVSACDFKAACERIAALEKTVDLSSRQISNQVEEIKKWTPPEIAKQAISKVNQVVVGGWEWFCTTTPSRRRLSRLCVYRQRTLWRRHVRRTAY